MLYVAIYITVKKSLYLLSREIILFLTSHTSRICQMRAGCCQDSIHRAGTPPVFWRGHVGGPKRERSAHVVARLRVARRVDLHPLVADVGRRDEAGGSGGSSSGGGFRGRRDDAGGTGGSSAGGGFRARKDDAGGTGGSSAGGGFRKKEGKSEDKFNAKRKRK